MSEPMRHTLNLFKEDLEARGYTLYNQLLNAKDYGIPQNRERYFLVAILGDYYFKFPQKQELQLRLKDMLEDEVDEKYYLRDYQVKALECSTYESRNIERKVRTTDDICETLNTMNGGNRESMIYVPEATQKGYAEAHDGDGVYINRPHQKRGVVQQGLIQTLKTSCDDVGVVVNSNIKNINDENKTFSTLGTNCGSSTSAGGGVIVLGNYSPSGHEASRILDSNGLAPTFKENHGTINATQTSDLRIRKLTPLECYRLMGFNDEDYYKASQVCSNSQLYRQAGNSIVVNVLMAIFKELLK
jgi:DNA (cytosine-5)-methyltransferase 1